MAGALMFASRGAEAQQWKPSGPPATAPSKAAVEEAKERFKKGLKLYQEDGSIEPALIELERAYDLAPNYKVLYNIGQVARSLPDYVTSLRAFERYLADGGRDIPAARKTEVEKDVTELKDRVASLEITTNMPGAVVTIDDINVGKTPLGENVMVNAGRRKITVTKDNLTATKTVTVAGRDTLKVDLQLEAPKEPQPQIVQVPVVQPPATPDHPTPPVQQQPPPQPQPDKPSYLWIGWVATGAFAVGSAITGGLAITASNDLKTQKYAGSNIPSDVTSQKNKVQTFAVLADIFAGAAAASFGITLVVSATSGGKTTTGSAPASAPVAKNKPQHEVRIRVAPSAVSVGGSF